MSPFSSVSSVLVILKMSTMLLASVRFKVRILRPGKIQSLRETEILWC